MGLLGKTVKGLADVVDGRTFFHNTDAEVSGLLEARPSRTGSGIFGLEKAGANYGANSIPFKVRGKVAGPEVDDNLNSIVKEVTGSNVSDYSSEGLYEHLLGFVPEQEVQAIFKQAGYGARARKSKGVDVIQAFGSDDVIQMDTPSRMARAKEQGFDVDAPMYHGSSKGGYNDTHDIKAFDLDKAGDKWNQDEGGFFFTSNPEEANYYATTDSTGRTVNGAVYPTFIKTKNPLIIDSKNDSDLASEQGVGYWDNRHEELMKKARDGGYDSIRLIDRGAYEDGYDVMSVVLEPSNIRSPSAAFDPAKTGSSNLLASNPAATTGAVGMSANANGVPQGILDFAQGRDTLLTKQESDYLNNAKQLQGLLGAKDNNFYNYSDIAPLKRHKDTGDYSLAMTGILRDVIEAGHDALIQPQNTGITNRKSLWDMIL